MLSNKLPNGFFLCHSLALPFPPIRLIRKNHFWDETNLIFFLLSHSFRNCPLLALAQNKNNTIITFFSAAITRARRETNFNSLNFFIFVAISSAVAELSIYNFFLLSFARSLVPPCAEQRTVRQQRESVSIFIHFVWFLLNFRYSVSVAACC